MFFSASSWLIAKPFYTLSCNILLVSTLFVYNSSEKLVIQDKEEIFKYTPKQAEEHFTMKDDEIKSEPTQVTSYLFQMITKT